MNQLTVMLNGNGPNGPHHQPHQAGQQFFTFAGQPTVSTQGAITLEQQQQQHQAQHQLGANQQPQLVTFQSQPAAAGTMMLQTTPGSQAYSGAQSGMTQQGAIQYFITQPQQPTQQQILAPTQSQFGIVQNTLLAAPGMNAMFPINQSLVGPNGTIQIPTQTLVTPNGTLQPSFVTMNQQAGQTIQFQNTANGTTQLFHQQPQFQLQAPSLAGSAITITNPTGQLINGPNGQQFVLNQTIAPTNQPTTGLLSNQAQAPPIYQFVLPNGQVIQTMQPSTSNTLISPQLMHQPNGGVQQPTAITVPIQATQTGQAMNILTAPNLTLAPGQTTTFITQPNASNLQSQPNSSTIIQSPNLQGTQNGLVITTPTSGTANQQPLIINTSPQIQQANQSLLIPAVSTANQQGQQQQQQTNNTTAMVVLTQSNNSSVIPNTVLDQKSIKQNIQSPQQTLVLIASPKMKPASSHTLVSTKLVNNNSSNNNANLSASLDASKQNSTFEQTTASSGTKIIISPLTKPRPIPCDQSTQCDDHPQITKMLESMAELNQNDESQSSEKTNQDEPIGTDTNSQQPSEPERPSRPSSTSSCGSLKIAEEEEMGDEEEEREKEENEDTENHDALSTETELDNNSVNESEIEQNPQSEESKKSTVAISSTVETKQQQSKDKSTEDKEGYQSSYGSPCHFTDTEDEEEEELELVNGDVTMDGEQEIKLVRKNGLTKAAYDLINNRLSDCGEDATTNDSKSSFTSGAGCDNEAGRECADEDEASNDSNAFSLQTQTPSPAGSIASAQMEPESTTHNWAAIKEKTIINIKGRYYNSIDLQPIRDFAKSFKLFRLSRGLTQSQVCQDLALKTDGQSYSQSAICRFEKLDITPKSAVKIKPVLENWVRASEEKYPKSKLAGNSESFLGDSIKESSVFSNLDKLADLSGKNGGTSEDETISSLNSCISLEPGKKRKKRTSFTPEQLDSLNHFFEKSPKPTSEEMTEIARILGSHDPKINRDVVRVWFCNKRQALKAKKPNLLDQPTPPPPPSQQSPKRKSEPLAKTAIYSVPQPLGPIEAPKLVGLNTSNHNGTNHLLSTGALTFPYPSAVSAIPLTLSTSTSTSVPINLASKTAIIRTPLPPLPQSSALNLAHFKQMTSSFASQNAQSTNSKPSTITAIKAEES